MTLIHRKYDSINHTNTRKHMPTMCTVHSRAWDWPNGQALTTQIRYHCGHRRCLLVIVKHEAKQVVSTLTITATEK